MFGITTTKEKELKKISLEGQKRKKRIVRRGGKIPLYFL